MVEHLRITEGSLTPRFHSQLGPLPVLKIGLALVNAAQTDAELNAVRTAIKKAEPFGGDAWKAALKQRLGIRQRKRGRPLRSRDALFEK